VTRVVRTIAAPTVTESRPTTRERVRRHGDRPLAGTWRLVRLVVRRDRLRLVLWLGGLAALMAVSARSIASMYETPDQIAAYVRTVGDNPALVMFSGPGYGFDDPSSGAILVNETTLWMSLGVGLMSVFLVNRHTRAEEESERMDLLRALAVGRHAHLVAALLVAVAANLAVGALCALAVVAFGFPLAGTVALSAGISLVGCAFAAATAVAAQVAATGRAALGIGTASVALAFTVRGIGDVSAPALSWLTPFGWGIGVRAYAGERWGALAGLAAIAVVLTAVAVELAVRRDLGSGMLPQRAGRDRAPRWSCRPLGLTVRLQRNVVLGWSVGIALMGLVYGSVADDIDQMLADNPELADYITQISGATLAESYLSTALRIIALAIAGFSISSALRARAEEASGHAEPVLATPVSRWRWAGAHLVVTVVATLMLTLVSGFTVGVGYAASVDDWGELLPLTVAALATLPSILVLAGITFALFGWSPRATLAAWVGLAVAAIVSLFGTVLRLPGWLIDVSPFEHAPGVPAEPWSAVPIIVLGAIAAALFAAGLVGFRRRDLTTE
jgi:ABC-2 type transport system permease protein